MKGGEEEVEKRGGNEEENEMEKIKSVEPSTSTSFYLPKRTETSGMIIPPSLLHVTAVPTAHHPPFAGVRQQTPVVALAGHDALG